MRLWKRTSIIGVMLILVISLSAHAAALTPSQGKVSSELLPSYTEQIVSKVVNVCKYIKGEVVKSQFVSNSDVVLSTMYVADSINVRKTPSLNAEIIGNLYSGTQVNVYAIDSEWLKIDFEGKYAYIHSEFAVGTEKSLTSRNRLDLAKAAEGEKGVVKSEEPVSVRTAPSDTAEVIKDFSKGDVVEVFGSDGKWLIIKVEDKFAYIESDSVLQGTDSLATPTPEPTLEPTEKPTQKPTTNSNTSSSSNSSSSSSSSSISSSSSAGSANVKPATKALATEEPEEEDEPEEQQSVSSNSSANDSSSASASGYSAVEIAQRYLGTPYVYGGASPGGFDCSGLTSYVYSRLGIYINRTSSAQFSDGYSVSKSNLQPGDLVFFSSQGRSIGHVGIYVGDGMMIHAPQTGDVVRYADITSGYYLRTYYGARRIAD